MITILFVLYLASQGVIPVSAGWCIGGTVIVDTAISSYEVDNKHYRLSDLP